jgi:hypothetical protein
MMGVRGRLIIGCVLPLVTRRAADGEKSKDKSKGDRSKSEDLKVPADKSKAGSSDKHAKKSLGKSQDKGGVNGEEKAKGAAGDKGKPSGDKGVKLSKPKGETKPGKDGEKTDAIVVSGSEKEDEGAAGQDGVEWREGADLEAAIAFLKQQKKAALLLRKTDNGEGDGDQAGAGKKGEEEDEDEEEDLRWMRGSGPDPSDGPREGEAASHRGSGGREGVSTLLHAFSHSGLFPRTGGAAGDVEEGGQGLEALPLDEGLKYVVLLLMQEGIYARKLQVIRVAGCGRVEFLQQG